MKKKAFGFTRNAACLLILLIFFFHLEPGKVITAKAAGTPPVSAEAVCLLDVETGQILYGKNLHNKRPPASLTKVLTTIIAIEESNLKDIVKISPRAAYQEGSSIYLEEGEKISLEELLYGVMLASGNDAAVAVAEHISGSVDEFAELMNKRAREIGALNSNFTNPSGLPEPDHYSTAYDLGLIMTYALKNRVFAAITATKTKTISWEGYDWGRGLRNHNKLLWLYPDATGGKTGYTRLAGRCLLASGSRNNRGVVVALLNAPDDWLDARKLMDYGLDNFKEFKVVEKGEVVYQIEWEESREGLLKLVAAETAGVVIPRGGKLRVKKEILIQAKLELPIKKGDIIGKLNICREGRVLSASRLLAGNDLSYNSLFLRFLHWVKELPENRKKGINEEYYIEVF